MSGANNNDNNNNAVRPIIEFNITETMKKAGIRHFFLKHNDFVIKFDEGRMRCYPFDCRNPSVSEIVKKMNQKLKNEPDYKSLKIALQDIENQLIERSEEIFSTSRKVSVKGNETDEYRSSYIDKVTKLRQQRLESKFSYQEWQLSVAERYNKLRSVVEKNFPDAWPLLEFCLSVKTILNVEGCTLPFIGVLLDVPSSLKTLVVELFRKYPHSFYSDSFTPNSLISHNSALTEEELQEVDMIPKMRNKLVLTPEMASIFTSKDDDLRKILGHITRLADGHGLESDSGAQGHRKYGKTFFVWVGAAVEIPSRVWRLLGTLGHKICFFRSNLPESSIEELERIASSNSHSTKVKEVEEELYDYLVSFDAFPDTAQTHTDHDGILKVLWNEDRIDEQKHAIKYLAKLANLLAHLRGTVYISESKFPQRNNNASVNTETTSPSYAEDLDYDNGIPIIENPTRAVTILRNLAVAHAIMQGRDYMSVDNIPMVIRIVLSTTMIGRSKVFELLIKHDSGLSSSIICNELGVSPPTARRAMRELYALKLAEISTIAGYSNTELMITLREEFKWIKTKEFKELWNKTKCQTKNESGKQDHDGDNNSNSPEALESNGNVTSSDDETSKDHDIKDAEACDTDSRPTPKANPPPETQENNSNEPEEDDIARISTSEPNDKKATVKLNDSQHVNNKEEDDQLSSGSEGSRKGNVNNDSISEEKNNTSLRGSKYFQRVTTPASHAYNQNESANNESTLENSEEKKLVLKLMLKEIENANGSTIAVSEILRSLCDNNKIMRNCIGDKLSQRENRKVRELFRDINRHKNIEPVKYKPQFVVKWRPTDEEDQNN